LLLDPTLYKRWEARAEAVRAAAGRLIGARAHEIAFVRSTSEGLSLVASGLSWQRGDNVVTVADEYPSNVYPWFGLRRWGVETRLLARPRLRFGPDEIASLVDSRTRVLAVSAVDWQSGFLADLAALGELCRARGLLFAVDAIQAVGALQIDVAACGIDVLAAGGHKWLLAPEGCGMLFVSDRVVGQIHPVVLGWKSVDNPGVYLPYHFDLRGDAARLEPGSAPHLGIHALGAALDLLLEVGPAAIEARVLDLTEQLADGLRRLGATILSPREGAERSAILTFALGDTAALHQALTDAGIIVRQRLGGIRLAPHFYNDAGDVRRVLEVVQTFSGGGRRAR
jgi:selenocysteine lyase/cysteine desulfurase